MSSLADSFVPFKKKGSGNFSSRGPVYYKLVDAVTPIALRELGKVTPTPGEPFVIGEYACADGGTSYELINKAIDLVRKKYGESLPIQVVYEDQPVNDFAPIFMRGQELTTKFPNVHVLTSGTTFYQQCLPENSADIILCFSGIYWSSRRAEISSPELFPGVTGGPVNEWLSRQAEEDWEQFLLLRAKELKPGGCLVVTSVDESESPSNEVLRATHFLFERIWEDMFRDGLINESEYQNTHVLCYCRTVEELEQPFRSKTSRVSTSGLVLTSVCKELVKCPQRDHWQTLISTGQTDPVTIREHARSIVDERRSWEERSIYDGLDEDRNDAEKDSIVNECFERYCKLIESNPPEYHYDQQQLCVVIKKQISFSENGI